MSARKVDICIFWGGGGVQTREYVKLLISLKGKPGKQGQLQTSGSDTWLAFPQILISMKN